MNPDIDKLQPYPFEKLAALKQGCAPAVEGHIALSIGEPKHAAPAIVIERLKAELDALNRYPLTRGMDSLREAIAAWLQRRFDLPGGSVDAARHVIPVNGTREALFAFAQCFVDRTANAHGAPLVLMPNPFYQIYEGACLLAGAEPYYYPTLAANNYLPDFDAIDADTWRRCQILYLCSPGNPTGAVLDLATLQKLIALAEQYDFIIASDECYSEIYFDEAAPPPGLLQAAHAAGKPDFDRCVVFHSLSKRSNLPGLRSGFVAGDSRLIKTFLHYRTYHGCAMAPPAQRASVTAWGDEAHVRQNRQWYREKFDAVLSILQPVIEVNKPQAGFYLWLRTPLDDTRFARELYASQNVTVLPGSYLSRRVDGLNPGQNHVRMALVAPVEECELAARRIRDYIESL